MAVYFAAIVVLVAGMIGLSSLLGPKRRAGAADQPYESGVVPVGTARLRFPVKFYLVAVFFVVFDLEAVYLTAWAIALRQSGWSGYAGALVFVAALLAGLAYLWRLGALDWGTRPRIGR